MLDRLEYMLDYGNSYNARHRSIIFKERKWEMSEFSKQMSIIEEERRLENERELKKYFRPLILIKVFGIIGLIGGLGFGLDFFIRSSYRDFGIGMLILCTISGVLIGIGLPSVWVCVKWTWKKTRSVLSFISDIFPGFKIFEIIVAALVIYFGVFIWGPACPIVSIYRYVSLKRQF